MALLIARYCRRLLFALRTIQILKRLRCTTELVNDNVGDVQVRSTSLRTCSEKQTISFNLVVCVIKQVDDRWGGGD